MKEQIFDINTSDGFALKTILFKPKIISKIVILCHGISSHKQEYLDMFPILSEYLGKKNIASLRFDFRGHGESSGRDIDFDVVSQIIDIESVIRWVKSEPVLAFLPMSFVGVSFGGGAGILYQKINNCFNEISLFAPVISYFNTFVKPTTEWGLKNFNQHAWEKAKTNGYLLLDGEFKVSKKLLTNFLLLEPLNEIPKINCPIQIYHGTKDNLVPCFIAENIKSSNTELHILSNVGHGLYVDGDDDGISENSLKIQRFYYETTCEFLSKSLK